MIQELIRLPSTRQVGRRISGTALITPIAQGQLRLHANILAIDRLQEDARLEAVAEVSEDGGLTWRLALGFTWQGGLDAMSPTAWTDVVRFRGRTVRLQITANLPLTVEGTLDVEVP